MLARLTAVAALVGLALPAWAAPKPEMTCRVTFQVAYLDRLNNTTLGVPKASSEDIQKRLRKFGDVCYAGDGEDGDLLFFVHTAPAVYHGHRVYTNTSSTSAAAVNGDSAAAAAATSSTTTAVPYSVDYSVFYLDVELPGPDSTFKILHTVDQKGLYKTIYGIGYGKGKHPIPNAIEAAAEWVHDEYLGSGDSKKW